MIHALIQPKNFKPEIGDIAPFPHSNVLTILPPLNLDKNIVSVSSLGHSTPFKNLEEHNIDTFFLKHTYNCPHTGLTFYSLAPLYIISDDISKYIQKTDFNPWYFDNKWQWDNFYDASDDPKPYSYSKTKRAMLGTGFTYGCLASDGDSRLIQVGIELDNGDTLVCLTWEWLNN